MYVLEWPSYWGYKISVGLFAEGPNYWEGFLQYDPLITAIFLKKKMKSKYFTAIFIYVSCLFLYVEGHGAIVSPVSRNAIDRLLPWDERTPPEPCTCANSTAGSAGPHSKNGCDNAQACYWYSQGCTIGCPTCDSVNGRQQVDLCGLGRRNLDNNIFPFLL